MEIQEEIEKLFNTYLTKKELEQKLETFKNSIKFFTYQYHNLNTNQKDLYSLLVINFGTDEQKKECRTYLCSYDYSENQLITYKILQNINLSAPTITMNVIFLLLLTYLDNLEQNEQVEFCIFMTIVKFFTMWYTFKFKKEGLFLQKTHLFIKKSFLDNPSIFFKLNETLGGRTFGVSVTTLLHRDNVFNVEKRLRYKFGDYPSLNTISKGFKNSFDELKSYKAIYVSFFYLLEENKYDYLLSVTSGLTASQSVSFLGAKNIIKLPVKLLLSLISQYLPKFANSLNDILKYFTPQGIIDFYNWNPYYYKENIFHFLGLQEGFNSQTQYILEEIVTHTLLTLSLSAIFYLVYKKLGTTNLIEYVQSFYQNVNQIYKGEYSICEVSINYFKQYGISDLGYIPKNGTTRVVKVGQNYYRVTETATIAKKGGGETNSAEGELFRNEILYKFQKASETGILLGSVLEQVIEHIENDKETSSSPIDSGLLENLQVHYPQHFPSDQKDVRIIGEITTLKEDFYFKEPNTQTGGGEENIVIIREPLTKLEQEILNGSRKINKINPSRIEYDPILQYFNKGKGKKRITRRKSKRRTTTRKNRRKKTKKRTLRAKNKKN